MIQNFDPDFKSDCAIPSLATFMSEQVQQILFQDKTIIIISKLLACQVF